MKDKCQSVWITSIWEFFLNQVIEIWMHSGEIFIYIHIDIKTWRKNWLFCWDMILVRKLHIINLSCWINSSLLTCASLDPLSIYHLLNPSLIQKIYKIRLKNKNAYPYVVIIFLYFIINSFCLLFAKLISYYKRHESVVGV